MEHSLTVAPSHQFFSQWGTQVLDAAHARPSPVAANGSRRLLIEPLLWHFGLNPIAVSMCQLLPVLRPLFPYIFWVAARSGVASRRRPCHPVPLSATHRWTVVADFVALHHHHLLADHLDLRLLTPSVSCSTIIHRLNSVSPILSPPI